MSSTSTISEAPPTPPYRLLTPGPVPAPPSVLAALAEPLEHHRTPEFERRLKNVWKKLQIVFATTQPVFIWTSTGTGAMEAALVNTLSPGDEVIAIVSGKFGERWADMAEIFGGLVHRLIVPWGEALQTAQLRQALQDHPQTKLVLTQACETSTGVLHPIQDIAAIVAETPALLLVDAISALGALPLPMDLWKIDAMIGGSQKAFQLPTGMSFLSFSEKAWKQVEKARCPRFYFDARAELAANRRGETHFSSPVSQIKALDIILDIFTKDEGRGLNEVYDRIASISTATHIGIEALGLSLFPYSPSPTVTAIRLPQGVDGQRMRENIERHDHITLMGGQDQLKGKILRIGHMGAISNDDVIASIQAIGRALALEQQTQDDPQTQKRIQQAVDKTRQFLLR